MVRNTQSRWRPRQSLFDDSHTGTEYDHRASHQDRTGSFDSVSIEPILWRRHCMGAGQYLLEDTDGTYKAVEDSDKEQC